MGKKSKAATVKAKNKKIDPRELPTEKPPPLEEEVSRHNLRQGCHYCVMS